MAIDLNKTRPALGRCLSAKRNAGSMTQDDMAKRIGKSRSNLANIESGKQWPTLPTLLLIADALSLDAKDLLPQPARPAPRVVMVGTAVEFEHESAGEVWAILSEVGDGANDPEA